MKKYISIVLMLVVAMVLFTACPINEENSEDSVKISNKSEDTLAVGAVIGYRTGNNEISVNAEEITEKVYDSCFQSGHVSFARVDGNPEQYIRINIPEPDVKGLSETKRESIAEGYKDEIFEEFKKYGAAKYPEADTLEAIRMEAATLREVGDGAVKHLVIVDSGLSTTGYLDFRKGLLDANVEDIVYELEKKQAIPDLTDINVTWLYCGETADPQQKLSEAQKNKLKTIYKAIFEAGNAINPDFSEEIPTATPYTGLPEVSTVNAEKRDITVPVMKTMILDSSKVSFVGDKDTFVNPEKAKGAIRKVAETLDENPESRVYIAGSTAGTDGDRCRELSEERAKAVVEVLKDFGIPKDRLIPIGLGSNAPWHIPDTDSEGNMIEKNAQLNRCVYIVDVNDPQYGDTLASY